MKKNYIFYADCPLYTLSMEKLVIDNENRYGLKIATSSISGQLLFKSYDECYKYLLNTIFSIEKSNLFTDGLPF